MRRAFFLFIKEEQLSKYQEQTPIDLPKEDKKNIEKEIREIAGITDIETPVILDIESVRVTGAGKFEIDLVNLFNKKGL